MKIPFEELIQDVRCELISSGFDSSSDELDDLKDIDNTIDLLNFLESYADMDKDEAYAFIFNLCVESE